MKILPLIATFALLTVPVQYQALGQEDMLGIKEGPNVKMIRNDDGSLSVYQRTEGQKGMKRTTYDASGRRTSIILYFIGKWGHLTSCQVFDSNKNMLYMVSYGYDKQARLREEQMYSASEVDPKTGKPLLVRRFIYTYDALGNRSKPVAIVLVAGEKYKKWTTTAPDKDPFAEEDNKKK